jgi:hypothetical protein
MSADRVGRAVVSMTFIQPLLHSPADDIGTARHPRSTLMRGRLRGLERLCVRCRPGRPGGLGNWVGIGSGDGAC